MKTFAVKIERNLAGRLSVPCGSDSYVRLDGRKNRFSLMEDLHLLNWRMAVVIKTPGIGSKTANIVASKGLVGIPDADLVRIVTGGSYY